MSGATPFAPDQFAPDFRPTARDSARSDITRAVETATSGSHTPFGTLVAIAGAESSFRTDVKNKRSTAAGPYQITETTWLHLVKTYGAAVGRPDLASLVHQSADGKLSIAAADRSSVLEARHDVNLSSQLAAKYCDECRNGLAKTLGRPPSEEEVRVAYFLGVAGATRLINAAAERPGTPISALLPKAFANHRGMFSTQGRSLNAAQALDLLQTRYAAQIARSDALRSYASAHDLRGHQLVDRAVEVADLPPPAMPPAAQTPPAEAAEARPPEPTVQVAAAEGPKELACKSDERGGVTGTL